MLMTEGDASWALPLNLGTDEAVYVEDNTWNFAGSGCPVSAVFDMALGGRIVFRHNNVTGTYAETHATRGSGRGGLKYEIYNSTFTGNGFIWPGMLRFGTGVIFNNTISGYGTNNFVIDKQRTCIDYSGKYDRCIGTNSYDGNTPGEYSWPCLDQIGRGSGVAPGSPQASVPLYSWNNGSTGTCATGGTCNNSIGFSVNANFDLWVSSPPPTLEMHIKSTLHSK